MKNVSAGKITLTKPQISDLILDTDSIDNIIAEQIWTLRNVLAAQRTNCTHLQVCIGKHVNKEFKYFGAVLANISILK